MSINKDISCFGDLNKNIKLAVIKIKDYQRFVLYQVYKKVDKEYKPLYKTTLEPHELKDYEVLDE